MSSRSLSVLLGLATMLAACSDPAGTERVRSDITYDDGFTLYSVDTTGVGRVELAQSDETLFDASWSPDGRRAVFTRQVCGIGVSCTYRLLILDAETGVERPLVGGGGNDATNPAWSPSGDFIAYLQRPSEPNTGDGSAELHVIRADGLIDRRVGTDHYYVRDPSWSPNGQQIAATTDDMKIVIVNASNGTRVRLLGSGYGPSWSPDGSRLAFTGDEGLVAVSINGSPRDVLTEFGYEAAWSPDGRWVAFERLAGSGSSIVIVRSDGTEERVVNPPGEHGRRPAWRRRP